MATEIALIASDWHLAPGAWARHPTLRGDAYHALEQAVDACLARRLPMVAPGDLFDANRPDARSVAEAVHAAGRLHAAGLPLYFIQGQHDMSDVPWLSLHPHPEHMHGRDAAVGGLTLRFLDYQPAGAFADCLGELAARPPADVLVAHQPWREVMGSRAPLEFSLSAVSGVRMVLSGDYHHPLVRDFPGRDGPLRYVSPGALALQAIDEPVDKHCLLLYDDLSVRPLPLRSRRVVRLDLTGPGARLDADRLRAALAGVAPDPRLPPALRRPILHARCADTLEGAYELLRELAEGRFHLFYSAVPTAPAAAAAWQEVPVDGDLLEAALHEEAPGAENAAVRRAARELLTGPLPSAAAFAAAFADVAAAAEAEAS